MKIRKLVSVAQDFNDNKLNQLPTDFLSNITLILSDNDSRSELTASQAYDLLVALVKAKKNNEEACQKLIIHILKLGDTDLLRKLFLLSKNDHHEDTHKKEIMNGALKLLYDESVTINVNIVSILIEKCIKDPFFALEFLDTTAYDEKGKSRHPSKLDIVKKLGAYSLVDIYKAYHKKYEEGESPEFYNNGTQCIAVHVMRALASIAADKGDNFYINQIKDSSVDYIPYAAYSRINEIMNVPANPPAQSAVDSKYLQFLKCDNVIEKINIEKQKIHILDYLSFQLNIYYYNPLSWNRSNDSKALCDELFAFQKYDMGSSKNLTGKKAIELYDIMYDYMNDNNNKNKTLFKMLTPIYQELENKSNENNNYQHYKNRKNQGYYIVRADRKIKGFYDNGRPGIFESKRSEEIAEDIMDINNPDRRIERKKYPIYDVYLDVASKQDENMSLSFFQNARTITIKEPDNRGHKPARMVNAWNMYIKENQNEKVKEQRFYKTMFPLLDEMQKNKNLDDMMLNKSLEKDDLHGPRISVYKTTW